MSHPPFVATQIQALIEDVRLLEVFVIAPLGLHSDIKMLREAIPAAGAANLSNSEIHERRVGYRKITTDPAQTTLETISHIRATINALGTVRDGGGPFLDPEWVSQAGKVLVRAEQKVAGDLRGQAAAGVRGLYVIVDPEATNGRPVIDVARAALTGGASVLQLRDKHGGKGAVLRCVRDLKALCDKHGAVFIVNDDADLAVAGGADGLHLGQTDLPVAEARQIVTQTTLIGRSNNSIDEAMASEAGGADYLAVGAVYATSTMGKSGRNTIGPETVAKVKSMVDIPVVAIGGIDAGNVGEVVRAGADCACVVSAVTMADDPEAAAGRLVEAIRAAS